MKNLSIVLNVVCLVAIAVLFAMVFSGNKEGTEETTDVNGTENQSKTAAKVVYVNQDSVAANFLYFKEQRDELKAKYEKADNDLRRRAQALQQEMNNFQNAASNMTRAQATAYQEEILQKRQNLQMREQSVGQEFMAAQNELTQQIYEDLIEAVNEYSADKNLEMVVNKTAGSDILFAVETMDVTQDIIQLMNDTYTAKKENPTVESDSTSTK